MNSNENNGEILDFTYRPKTKTKEAKTVLFGALIVSALLVIASIISPKYKGVISLFAVVALVYVVYVFTRYLSAQYAYAVMTTNQGENLLIVTKTVGKNVSTLAMIRLADITLVERATPEMFRSSDKSVQRHNFCPSMKPDEVFFIRTATRYTKQIFMLEINDAVASRISEYSIIAKENEPDE